MILGALEHGGLGGSKPHFPHLPTSALRPSRRGSTCFSRTQRQGCQQKRKSWYSGPFNLARPAGVLKWWIADHGKSATLCRSCPLQCGTFLVSPSGDCGTCPPYHHLLCSSALCIRSQVAFTFYKHRLIICDLPDFIY